MNIARKIIFAVALVLLLAQSALAATYSITTDPSADCIGQTYKDAGTTLGGSGDTFVEWKDTIGTNHILTNATGATPIVCDGIGLRAGVLVPVGCTGSLKIPATLQLNSGSWTVSIVLEMFGNGVQNALSGSSTRWLMADGASTYFLFFDYQNATGHTMQDGVSTPVAMPLPAFRSNLQVLTITGNHASGNKKLYINGTLAATLPNLAGTTNNYQILFNAFAGGESAVHAWACKCYQITMYKTLLSDADIAAQAANRLAAYGGKTSWIKRVVLIGDSKMQGLGTGTQGATFSYLLCNALPDTEVYNLGSPSEQANADVLASSGAYLTNLVRPLFDSTKTCYGVIALGHNDVAFNSATATQLWSGTGTGYLEQITTTVRGYGYHTVICTSDDGSGNTTIESVLATASASIRSGYAARADAVADFAAIPSVSTTGLRSDVKLYPDGIHPSSITTAIEDGTLIKAINAATPPAMHIGGNGVRF